MDLFLIAHKVRGEPAFDIAERMVCPNCSDKDLDLYACPECDGEGFWWIVSTSGHRAYPYWSEGLYEFSFNEGLPDISSIPPSLPDHYPTRQAPKDNPSSGKSLLAALGLLPKVQRRL